MNPVPSPLESGVSFLVAGVLDTSKMANFFGIAIPEQLVDTFIFILGAIAGWGGRLLLIEYRLWREKSLTEKQNQKEWQRDEVVVIINEGIDKMSSLFESHQRSLNSSPQNNQRISFPHLRWHDPSIDEFQLGNQIVNRHILLDIQQDREELPKRFERYKNLCLEYNGLYSKTQTELEAYIEADFLDEFEDKIESIEGEQNMLFEEEIQAYSHKLARRILSAFEDPAYGYTEINEDLLSLRDEPFSDEVERMEELITEIEVLNEEILDELSEMREEYKSEYNILETELSVSKEETA